MSDTETGESTGGRRPAPSSAGPLDAAALAQRLGEDEARLARDEALLVADEARLVRDEQRLAADEETARLARRLSVMSFALAAVLAIAMAGVVIGVIAVREDVHAISSAAPEDSVSTGSIEDAAVTTAKLADRSVTAGKVRRDSLTGAEVRESTLTAVPRARVAQTARNAADATQLGGLSKWAYLSKIETTQASSATDTRAWKGPLTARCPFATHVVSGGAAVEGSVSGVAIVRSAPAGTEAWVAAASGGRRSTAPWRLVVHAICATGGR